VTTETYTRYASLDGRTVLITGGASGIGAELVVAFTAQGSRVHFLDINAEAGGAVAAATGTRFHPCDLRDIMALRSVIAAIEAEEGAIDVLVNNAANDDRHPMQSVEPAYWRDRLALNLDHQFFATQAVAPAMIQRGRGVVLLTSSTSFMMGMPGMVAYTTAKAAVLGLNRTLARELGGAGIRVNCIVPGAVTTDRQEKLWRSPEVEADILRKQALKIRLQARDIASMALFLASDDARGCTGAEFVVDAGMI